MPSRLAALLLVAAAACAPAEEGSRLAGVTERVSATVYPSPYEMPDVTLTDQTGEPFHLASEAMGKVTLLFFGYTNCPDICPITMASVAAGLDRLAPAERERVLTVFVTLDPPRDDSERMADWLARLDSSFVGLTGTQDEVDGALAELGFVMPPVPMGGGTAHEHGGDPSDYEVAHPTALFVFTPDGIGRFGYGNGEAQPETIAADLRTLLAFDWSEAPGT